PRSLCRTPPASGSAWATAPPAPPARCRPATPPPSAPSEESRMACRISELVLDARDPERLAAFWCEVLGYTVLERAEGGIEIGPAAGFGGLQPTLVLSPSAD